MQERKVRKERELYFFKCMHDVIQVDQKYEHAKKFDTQVYYWEVIQPFVKGTALAKCTLCT